MTAIPPAEPTTAGIELDQVRTTADAAAWLRHCATSYLADADGESSPSQARALRTAGSTLEVYAAVIGTIADPGAIGAELARHATDYRHPERHTAEPVPEHHRLVCGHLADVLGDLAEQLTGVSARPQHQRGLTSSAGGRSIDL